MAKKKAAKKKAGKKKAAKKAAPVKKAAPAKKAGKKKAGKKKAHRTVMRSSAGKKLYAKRNTDGTFNDIQQFSTAHAIDVKRDAIGEG